MTRAGQALSIGVAFLLSSCGGEKLAPDRELFGRMMASSDVRGFEIEPRLLKEVAAQGLEAFEVVHGSRHPLRGASYREFLFPVDAWRPAADPDEACRIETVVRFRIDSGAIDLLSSPTCGRLFLVSQGRCIGASDSGSSASLLTALHKQVTFGEMSIVP